MKNVLGFTLPEIIVGMTISVITGVLLLQILINNTGLFYRESAKVSQGVGINDALAEIREILKQAASVEVSYTDTATSTVYQSNLSELVIKLPALDSTGNILPAIFDYVVYTLSSTKLYEKIFPDPSSSRDNSDRFLVDNVVGVLFEYLDDQGSAVTPQIAEKIKVTITLRQKAGLDFSQSTATSEVNLRND